MYGVITNPAVSLKNNADHHAAKPLALNVSGNAVFRYIKIWTLLILVSVFLGCTYSKANKQITDTELVNTIKPKTPEVIIQEYLDKDSVRINGKLSLISKTTELYNVLGKPDSIVSPDLNDICVSFYDRDYKYAYFGNTQFEIYGDTSVLVSINFVGKSKLELKTPNLILNNTITLEQLGRLFPKSVKDKYELNFKGIGKTVAVSIAISKKPSDDSWLFLFLEGKLFRIDYYMLC